ncbi:NFACT RNA binding domain-containing protein [Ruminococcus sp. NK3A76]|uniref:Rqc2 family fibronectin-binding protein n=1 Tax=Ruminococcus sp. NK3A76 TaxID=877411 RepID=UPI00048F7461|nr:NFACT RNA binding domain-containing protein [Ruminococcus sp. NK3A76]
MALDGVFLGIVKNEISVLLDGRVDKIHQPSREEILITFRTREGGYKLLINTSAGGARVHVTRAQIDNPRVPPMFCMLMRKLLSSGKLISIRQDGQERILMLDFDSSNEMGDIVRITLVIEIMGRHSNLIILDNEGKIIDAIKRVGQDMSSVRPVLPGMIYEAPPKDKRLSLFSLTRQELRAALDENSHAELSKAILRSIEGLSPVFARECALKCTHDEIAAGELTDEGFEKLYLFLSMQAQLIEKGENKFTVLLSQDGLLKDFCFADINQYGSLMEKKYFSSACETLDHFFTQRDITARMKQRASDLYKFLQNTRDRINRRTANQRQELLECADRDKLKIYGDLLMANLYNFKKGDSFVNAQNYYEEGSPEVRIKLDVRLTPSQNAQRYYNEYRKADTAEKKLTKLIEQGEQELLYIDSVFDNLTRAQSETDIDELRIELHEQGYLRSARLSKGAKNVKTQPPMKFLSSDGYEIRVGRNNKQNDRLTCKDSEKLDIWLHVKEITGSHVIISAKGGDVPDDTIMQAAQIAAYYSSARSSAQVPVDYTLVKFVKKPNGAKPGMVIFTNNRTLYVKPDEELVNSLKAK